MAKSFETVGNAKDLSPYEALNRGVRLGILDPVNLIRFQNPEAPDVAELNGVIVPALRRASDFLTGEPVWIYEPPVHPTALILQYIDIEPQTGFLHCRLRGTSWHQYISDPKYYGLWRVHDILHITKMIKSHPGSGYLSPMYYINTIQEAADPTTPHDFIKKTTRKITEIARPRNKPQ